MIIEGYVTEKGEVYVPALLIIQELGIADEMTFLLDTGAERTIISEGDAERLGIDYSKLKKGYPALGIGGMSDTYVIKNVTLSFVSNGWLIVRIMKELELLKHETDDPTLKLALKSLPSLLGRDVLGRKFTISSDGKNATIDI